MKYFLPLFFGVLFFYAIFPDMTYATVRINEVAWMGTASSQYSEWIELYNDGATDVPLAGWTLTKTADVLLFTLTKTIAADGYLLVERTTASAPDAVPGINDESGTFGGGGLRNTGEDLTLKDNNGNPIYVLPYASGWPAGDTKTKDTMQWNGNNWITAPGTPDAVNATVNTSSSPTTTTAPVTIQTPIVIPPPIVTPVVTSTTTTPSPIVVPITATPQVPVPPIVVPTPVIVSVSSTPAMQPVVVPVTSVTASSKAPPKKVASKKTSIEIVPAVSAASNEAQADQLQASADTVSGTTNENNHTKIIVFIVVAFIGTAL